MLNSTETQGDAGRRGMSVELRMAFTGDCHCGIPYPIGENPGTCNHYAVCNWGVIEHPGPRPEFGEVGPLMLVTNILIDTLVLYGDPVPLRGGSLATLTTDGERIFVHHEYGSQRWTWELFDTHWWDGKGPEIYVGRWPD